MEVIIIKTIEELRKELNISQVAMSKKLNVSPKTLGKYEADSSNLPTPILKKYMEMFNVEFDDIFLGKKYEIYVQRKKKLKL